MEFYRRHSVAFASLLLLLAQPSCSTAERKQASETEGRIPIQTSPVAASRIEGAYATCLFLKKKETDANATASAPSVLFQVLAQSYGDEVATGIIQSLEHPRLNVSLSGTWNEKSQALEKVSVGVSGFTRGSWRDGKGGTWSLQAHAQDHGLRLEVKEPKSKAKALTTFEIPKALPVVIAEEAPAPPRTQQEEYPQYLSGIKNLAVLYPAENRELQIRAQGRSAKNPARLAIIDTRDVARCLVRQIDELENQKQE